MSNPNPYPTSSQLGALTADAPPSGKKAKAPKKVKVKGDKPTKRLVDRHLLLAVIAAVVVAVVVLLLMSSTTPGSFVVRAKTDIAALTPMKTDLVEVVRLPEDAVVPSGMHADSKDEALALAQTAFANAPRTKFTIPLGTQLSAADFGPDLALGTPLKDGERLMSISASVVNGVSGQLKPGDNVDIIGSAQTKSGVRITAPLAHNIPIVAVSVPEDQYKQAGNQQQSNKTTQDPEGLLPADPVAPGIYLVRVPADAALAIAAVENDGTLSLLYRGTDTTDLTPNALSAAGALCLANPEAPSCIGS